MLKRCRIAMYNYHKYEPIINANERGSFQWLHAEFRFIYKSALLIINVIHGKHRSILPNKQLLDS